MNIENQMATRLYFKEQIDYQGKPSYHYSTTINPHLEHSSIQNIFIDKKNDINLSFQEIINKELKNSSKLNLWSMLGGRQVSINLLNQDADTSQVFKCIMRDKNPFYNELFSLKFQFNGVMEESGYVSNKFVL